MATRVKREAYVAGSAARQLEGNYSNFRTSRVETMQKKPEQVTIRRTGTNPVQSLMLSLVIVLTMAIAVVLLKNQFIVTDKGETVIRLKQELVELNKRNEQLRSDINQSVDMDEVYRIATQEMGMIQAGKADIVYVDQQDQSYTVQYAKLESETAEKDLSLGNFLGFISKGW